MSEKNGTPSSWEVCALDDLLIKISNGANVAQYDEQVGHPISRIETIWNEGIDLQRVKYVKESSSEFIEKYVLRPGDILFSHINSDAHLGKTGLFKNQTEILIHGINILLLRPSKNISPEFVNFQLKYLRAKGIFIGVAQRAVNQSSINQAKLKSFQMAVAPIQEQYRIVTKIEELFSELDKGVESLKTAQAQLKVYRQALLKHAFEGKLTAQWRADNPDKLETADALIARIQRERIERYQQQLAAWESSSKCASKPKAPKPWLSLAATELAELSQLPEGWTWARLGNVLDIVSGNTPKGIEQTSGQDVPYYRVSDMNRQGNELFMRSSANYLSEAEAENLGLGIYSAGTILFPKRGGAIATNKKRRLSVSSCFDLNLMGLTNQVDSIAPDYLWNWALGLDLASISDGSNVPQINNRNVEPLALPICSAAEQFIIVQELDSKLSVADQLDQTITVGLREAEALRQSILKKTFSGQLVPQDPNDEPASALLARIKAEKSAQPQGKKARK